MADEREISAADSDTPDDAATADGSNGRDAGTPAQMPPANDAPASDEPVTVDQPKPERRSAESIIRRQRAPGGAEDERVASRPGALGTRVDPDRLPDAGAEIHHGSKPGSRYARLTRTRERTFERGITEGTLRATAVVDVPRSQGGRFWRQVKRLLIGQPLASSRLAEEKLSKFKALAIFASDALSSTAYATE